MTLREGLFRDLDIADKLEFIEEHELYRSVVPGRDPRRAAEGRGVRTDRGR